MQNQDFNEVVKMIEESTRKVDEVLKAAKLQRHEREPISKDCLSMILSYIMGGMTIILVFILLLVLMHYGLGK